MERTLEIPHQVYWATIPPNKVGVVSRYAILITSGDESINQSIATYILMIDLKIVANSKH